MGRINAETRTADDDLAEGDGEGMEELRTLRQALETLEGERVSLMDKLHEVVGEKEELVRMCQLVVKVMSLCHSIKSEEPSFTQVIKGG